MSNAVTNPFPLFYDRSGQPLNAGYIYVGTAGINPETSPLAVYWDAALTLPAAQPLRTLNGYPSRDGSASQVAVSPSSYSIVVRESDGTLVYSNLNYTPIINTTFPETGFEIAKPASGSTLAGNVAFSASANTILIYENGGAFRGVIIDIGNAGSKSTLTMNEIAQTLLLKTLTSPTVNGGTISGATIAGGALSGTFTGTPTFSGAVAFTGSPVLTTPTINGGTIQSRIQVSSEMTGTLTSASANKSVLCSGGVTLASAVFTAGDITLFDSNGVARTFTRGAGVTMYVNGANSATATLGIDQLGSAYWRTASVVVLGGAFS